MMVHELRLGDVVRLRIPGIRPRARLVVKALITSFDNETFSFSYVAGGHQIHCYRYRPEDVEMMMIE